MLKSKIVLLLFTLVSIGRCHLKIRCGHDLYTSTMECKYYRIQQKKHKDSITVYRSENMLIFAQLKENKGEIDLPNSSLTQSDTVTVNEFYFYYADSNNKYIQAVAQYESCLKNLHLPTAWPCPFKSKVNNQHEAIIKAIQKESDVFPLLTKDSTVYGLCFPNFKTRSQANHAQDDLKSRYIIGLYIESLITSPSQQNEIDQKLSTEIDTVIKNKDQLPSLLQYCSDYYLAGTLWKAIQYRSVFNKVYNDMYDQEHPAIKWILYKYFNTLCNKNIQKVYSWSISKLFFVLYSFRHDNNCAHSRLPFEMVQKIIWVALSTRKLLKAAHNQYERLPQEMIKNS